MDNNHAFIDKNFSPFQSFFLTDPILEGPGELSSKICSQNSHTNHDV